MAIPTRPTRSNIDSLSAAWGAGTEGNFGILLDEPVPWPIQDDADDQTDLQTNFPAAQYGSCVIWVKHSSLGLWIPYETNGNSEWRARAQNLRCPVTSITAASQTIAAGETVVLCSNASPQTITLPSVSAEAGRTITIKQLGVGAVTVQRGGSSTIDGATSYAIPAQYGAVSVYSDGTNWHILSKA